MKEFTKNLLLIMSINFVTLTKHAIFYWLFKRAVQCDSQNYGDLQYEHLISPALFSIIIGSLETWS